MKLPKSLHEAPYWARFSLLVLVAVAINMLGLGLTQWMGWSLLFFDMVGTAFASLLGGTAAGLMVALASNLLGSALSGDSSYLVYGYVNIAGALIWAVLPRTGRPIFGCYMFNLGKGSTYRRAFLNTLILGTMVGLVTSVVAWAITVFVLHGQAVGTYGAGTLTGANNGVLTKSLIELTNAKEGLGQRVAILLACLLTNIPDKIVATASAVLLIVSYRTLPNYKEQKRAIREGINPLDARIFSNKFILTTTCLAQIAIFPYAVFTVTNNTDQSLLMILFSFLVVALILIDPIYYRSIDRVYGKFESSSNLFYPVPDTFHMGDHKGVFEDILKLMAVAVSGSSFLIAMNSHAACVPETIASFERCGPLYELAAVNALIITGFRYICVVVIRLRNRR